MTSGHDKLRQPPVVEAVCELRVSSGTPFSLIPGAVSSALRDDFPSSTETEAAKVAGLMQLPAEAGLVVTHQFRSLDEKRLVQLGPAGISVNFTEYPGYERFSGAVDRVFRSFLEVADVQSVMRIGLRYINALPPGDGLFASLTASQDWPSITGGEMRSLAARATFGFREEAGTMAVAIASPHKLGTLLDLDFFSEPLRALSLAEILAWLDTAHGRVYEAFRAMIAPAVFTALR